MCKKTSLSKKESGRKPAGEDLRGEVASSLDFISQEKTYKLNSMRERERCQQRERETQRERESLRERESTALKREDQWGIQYGFRTSRSFNTIASTPNYVEARGTHIVLVQVIRQRSPQSLSETCSSVPNCLRQHFIFKLFPVHNYRQKQAYANQDTSLDRPAAHRGVAVSRIHFESL